MLSRKRIIPILSISDGNLVKTKKFRNPRYLGDPINAIKIFNEKMVDEMAVIDIRASIKGYELDYALLKEMASEAFFPLSYGGGINDINQIRTIFSIGYEKVIINCSPNNYSLISEASSQFGAQSIVVSIDYRKTVFGRKVYYNSGTKCTGNDILWTVKNAESLGAGEIILQSIDRDGMRQGYDIDYISDVASSVNIPVIAYGGADSVKDLTKVLVDYNFDAAAASSMFVFYGKKEAVLINYPSENILIEEGIIK